MFAFQTLESSWNHVFFVAIDPHTDCCNPSLGLATKARACKSAGQKGSLGGTSYIPGVQESVREWTLTLPSELPLWGVEVPVDSWDFRERLQGLEPIRLKSSLYHWKVIETQMSKMGLQNPFGHLRHKLWPKERLRIKLVVWLLTIKS